MSRRRVPRGVSTPGKRLCGPTYVGLAENLVVIRASRRRTGLGCDERSARSAFHRLDPRLAPSVSASLGSVFNRASRGLGTLVAWCRIARRRPAIRASASRYLAELGAAVDARSRVRRHMHRSLRGRCFVPTSATDSLQRAPDSDRAVLEVRVACASGTPRRSKLREATRVVERLTAPYELRKACGFTLGRIGPHFTGDSTSRVQPVPDWRPDHGPLGFTPRLAALSSARQESCASSDALQERPLHRSVEVAPRLGLASGLVKDSASSHAEAPSIDECSLDPSLAAWTSSVNPPPRSGFAAVTWLPTLFRLAHLVERSRLD